ncbi:MAG: response regulator transcription factor [Cyclobacteriaceae bacterium]
MKAKILLVDDHEMIRDAIKFYFKEDEDYEIAYEAANGLQALDVLEKNDDVDVMITDIKMPEMTGIQLMESVQENHPDLRVLVLSMFNEANYINKMISLGASGYVLKNTSKQNMKEALDKIRQDEDYYADEVYKTIIDSIARKAPKKRLTVEVSLSDREKEVLQLIVGELSNQEIADKLFISVRTVESHKRNLLEKTGCKNIAGLTLYAVEKDIV